MAELGREWAWDILAELAPEDVQGRACVSYDRATSAYCLTSLGQDLTIAPKERKISAKTPFGRYLVDALGYLSQLSVLRYLVDAKDIPLTGELVKPSELPGGEIFVKGTHVLPLNKITGRFDQRPAEFLQKGKELGGFAADYGDIAVRLLPFPRIPLVVAVWSGDEEFPANCSVLLDSSCALQIPTDIAWSTVLMAIELMAYESG